MIIALHIALLVQAPERSGWLPYLRMLPKKFDTMPVRYPPELLELLPQNAQGTLLGQLFSRRLVLLICVQITTDIVLAITVCSPCQQTKG